MQWTRGALQVGAPIRALQWQLDASCCLSHPAEGEPSDAADADAWGGASPSHSSPVRPRRRIPSSASLDSLESASSYGSNVSDGSSRRDYRAVIKGAHYLRRHVQPHCTAMLICG